MKNEYTIKIESSNPEYEVDKNIRDGLKADGFILVTFRDEQPVCEVLDGVSVANLAGWIQRKTEVGAKMRQAMAIAEGYLKAKDILDETRKEKGPHRLVVEGPEGRPNILTVEGLRDVIDAAIRRRDKGEAEQEGGTEA